MSDPELLKRINALTTELALVERKVDFLLRHLGVTFVDERPPPDDVERAILAGDRIGAIRLYQERHGASLADAKRAIDGIAARLGV